MSVRLTNWMRESIVNNMLAHRFIKGEYARFVKLFADLATDCYNDIYDEKARRTMNRLPDGWLRESNTIGVQFGTKGPSYMELDFSGIPYVAHVSTHVLRPKNFPSKELRKRTPSKDFRSCQRSYEKEHVFSVRYYALANAITEQVALHDKAKKQANAAIAQASTLKRLKEIWPECWPFAKAYEHNDARATLPVVRVADLNSIFKLPVGEGVSV